MPEQIAEHGLGFLGGGFNSVIENARRGFFEEKILDATFKQSLKQLPTSGWLKTMIETDQERWDMTGGFSFGKSYQTSAIRSEYVKNSFLILTDEFLKDIVSVVRGLGISMVVELCAGTGWLSHWLEVYGLKIQGSVDNKSWPGFEERYLSLVEEGDSFEYVEEHPDVELFILSWPPYSSDLATRIWEAMKEGAYLLYIGEGSGGCTADDEFFNALPEEEPETVALQSGFIAFASIHDQPMLYRKGKGGGS